MRLYIIVECSCQVWNPHKDLIDRMEKIQKKFSKAIPALSQQEHQDRLKALKLKSLEHRRLTVDLCLFI